MHRLTQKVRKTVLVENDNIINNDKKICEFFNSYFVNITDTLPITAPVGAWPFSPWGGGGQHQNGALHNLHYCLFPENIGSPGAVPTNAKWGGGNSS